MRNRDGVPPAVEGSLQRLFDSSPTFALKESDRVLILSDLHLGDGGSRDDFRSNGELLREVLARFYLPRGYTLVLNGDIEELQRFALPRIRGRWAELYELFGRFASGPGLHRIVGNHDEALWRFGKSLDGQPLRAGIRLGFGADTMFVFHGHQATIFFERFNDLSGFFLRHVAHRLHIRSVAVRPESGRRLRTEHRVYAFSTARGIASVIGHTHRALFESVSRGTLAPAGRNGGSTAGQVPPSPCLFNSGCAVGSQGLTAIEIKDGHITLVRWFDARRGDLRRTSGHLGVGPFCRSVLKRNGLDRVFSRIRMPA